MWCVGGRLDAPPSYIRRANSPYLLRISATRILPSMMSSFALMRSQDSIIDSWQIHANASNRLTGQKAFIV